jgi:alkylation response protein AidB-like acyl-CoA dehydrogenase
VIALDFEFSVEQEQLRESVARYLDAHAPLAWVRERYAEPRGTTDEVWRGLADLGATGLLVPESCGGAGMGMVDAAVVLEELGRVVHPGPYSSSAIGAASIVVLGGDERDRAAFLPGIADGSTVATIALFESERRAQWRAARTTARIEGESWRLDGTKVHVPDLVGAQLALVAATADDGLGVFAVALDAPGIESTPEATVDGSRKRGILRLDGAPALRIGDGDASDALAATVDRMGAASVVEAVGTAARALEISLEYAKQRQQFGVPIGSFQAVQHLCADMLRAVELARAAGYYACWACDAADPFERHRAVTMALAFSTDELYRVGASAVQVHGGIGYTWEHDVHLFYKRLLTLQETGGGAVDQLEELAAIVLAGSGDGSGDAEA